MSATPGTPQTVQTWPLWSWGRGWRCRSLGLGPGPGWGRGGSGYWLGWGGRGKGRGWRRGGAWPTAPGYTGVAPVNLQPGQMVLERVPPGTKVRVVSILAGAGAAGRALQMGIAPGTILEVVENNLAYPWSPIVVSVNGMTIAIGRGFASRIIVEPVTGQVQGQT